MGQELQIRVDQIQTNDEGTGGFWNKLQVWEDHFEEVQRVVETMVPGDMYTAANAYDSAVTAMDDSIDLIYNQANRLVEAWGGEDAENAMTQMNKAYMQAQEIHTKAKTTRDALNTHGQTQTSWKEAYGNGSPIMQWVSNTVSWGSGLLNSGAVGASTTIAGYIGNNWGAEDAMQSINNGTQESNQNFPSGIRQDMPQTDPNLFDDSPTGPGGPGGPSSPKMPGGPGGPGDGPGDIPGGPGGPEIPGGPGGPGDPPGGPGGPGDPPGGPGGPGNPPGGPGGPGNPPGGPGGPDFPGGGGPGGGTDLASMPGGGPGGGLGAGGVGGGPGGGPGLGAGGVGSGPGGLGAGSGSGAGGIGPGGLGSKTGMGGRGGMGMGMPMGAGARPGGDGGDEHERSTWLTEDEDVWGGGDDTAPPVIG